MNWAGNRNLGVNGPIQKKFSGRTDRIKSVASPDEEAPAQTGSSSPFKAIVALKQQRLVTNGLNLPIVAGMQLQAEIREGKRTVLEYLLSPVRRVVHEAGGER